MIFQSNFLPCFDYMAAIIEENEIKINISDQYRKQSYRNRAYILSPNTIDTLIIPIIKSPNNTEIKEIKIEYKEDWQKLHWKKISNSYRNSPYFEYYDYLIKPVFEKKVVYLIDFNLKCLTLCLKMLNINMTICQGEYSYFENNNEFISFNAKNRLENQIYYVPISYYQNFGNKFEHNLSILDLILNKGPESLGILKSSRKINVLIEHSK